METGTVDPDGYRPAQDDVTMLCGQSLHDSEKAIDLVGRDRWAREQKAELTPGPQFVDGQALTSRLSDLAGDDVNSFGRQLRREGAAGVSSQENSGRCWGA